MRDYKLAVAVGAIAIMAFAFCCYSPAGAQPPAGVVFQTPPESPAGPPPAAPAPAAAGPRKNLEELTTQPAVSGAATIREEVQINFNPPALLPPQPPKIMLSKEELETVKARLEYWKDALAKSKSDTEVMKIKDKLIEDYLYFVSRDETKANESPDYQISYGKLAASILGPLLNKGLSEDDFLKRQKEINLSMAMVGISQIYPTPAEGKEFRGNIEIVPVVERMVVHENPAVRYFGWRAYKNLRIQILANASREDKAVTNMQNLIKKGQSENSAVVLGSYFGMLDFPATDPLYGVKDKVLNDFRKECYDILKTLWGRWMPCVWQGDIAVANTFAKGLGCMVNLAPVAMKELNGKKILLQNIMDLLYCAANSFDRQWNQVPVTVESGQFPSWFQYLKSEYENNNRRLPSGASGVDNPIIQASIILTQECEKSFETILEVQKPYVKDAWKAGDIIMVGAEGQPKKPVLNDRSEKILDAVKKWADDLKEQGVAMPNIKEPPVLLPEELAIPASQPAKAAPATPK